jgi:hypothetical protein
MKITTIINYCSNEYMFLKACIEHARPFSTEVIVPYCNRFLDGTPENKDLLDKSTIENSNKATFVEFEYDPSQSSRWHHNAARRIGIDVASEYTEYFLLLDTDEIVESDRFVQWINNQEGKLLDSYKLANYFYFRDVKYRSKSIEDSVVFVKKGPLTNNDELVFHPEERYGLWIGADKRDRMCMLDNKPFIHHYSWVRSKEAMIRKVTSWGHNKDRDWVSLVNKEFEQPFRGKDVIFGDREYDIVEPYITL